jgi:hypothetical protein
MKTNSVNAHPGTVVTINAVYENDRLAITTRAQTELIELLAKLVLHNLELEAASDENGLRQIQRACGEFGNATNPRQVARRAGRTNLSPAASDVRQDCQVLAVVAPIHRSRSHEV